MNAIFTSLMAVAPIIVGGITQLFGWRGNYFIVAIICILSWLLLVICLPETKLSNKPLQLKQIINDFKNYV